MPRGLFLMLLASIECLGGEAPAPLGFSRGAISAELSAYAARAETELRKNILPFWLQHARDSQRGGFVGRIRHDMVVESDAPRGMLLSSRILWTFSSAYRRYNDPGYRAMADWAFADMMEWGWDQEHGGLFWTVTPGGRPLDSGKHIYGQAFGVYGLSEYYRATRNPDALERAVTLYRLIERHARDREHGGYFEAFTRHWRRDESGPRRIMGAHGPKSQNTHIHILEAYTNLLRVWPDDSLRSDLRALIELMLTRIVDPKTHHLILFFRDDWTPVSHEISYGHDIELSWLIVEAADVLGDPGLLSRAKAVALRMAEVTLAQGVDADGGVFNEGDPSGVTNANKDWWPQAEAAVGFLHAYHLSGDKRYFAASRRTWDFIEARCVDRKHGDWHESLTRDGTSLPRNKLSVWKCPYHNARACLEVIHRTEVLQNERAR